MGTRHSCGKLTRHRWRNWTQTRSGKTETLD